MLQICFRSLDPSSFPHKTVFPSLFNGAKTTNSLGGAINDDGANEWPQLLIRSKNKRSMHNVAALSKPKLIDYDKFLKRMEIQSKMLRTEEITSTSIPGKDQNEPENVSLNPSNDLRKEEESFDKIDSLNQFNANNINFKRKTTLNKKEKLYGQNLVILGHVVQDSFRKRIKKCSAYTEVDLFSKYKMSNLANNSGRPYGQLLIYFNLMEVNRENYDVALESIKRILDHFTVTYQGLALYSVLHSQESEGFSNKKYQKFDTDFHWKLNDATMSYCSTEYPRCHAIPDLSAITNALNESYVTDQTLEAYSSKRYSSVTCQDETDCNDNRRIQLDEHYSLSDMNLEQQLQSFEDVFCNVSYHRVIEFYSHFQEVQDSVRVTTDPPNM